MHGKQGVRADLRPAAPARLNQLPTMYLQRRFPRRLIRPAIRASGRGRIAFCLCWPHSSGCRPRRLRTGGSTASETSRWSAYDQLRKPPVLHVALDGPPASVVSRAGVSANPRGGLERVARQAEARVGAPIELGDDRRVPPLPAEGRPIGSSLKPPVPSSTRGGPAPRSAAAATPS